MELYQNVSSEDTVQVPKFRFKKKKHLHKHRFEMHEKPVSYSCKFCSKNFSVLKQFNTHVKRHEEKIQRKNKQLYEIPDKRKEAKETSQFQMADLSFNAESPFNIELRKRFKSSESEKRVLLFEDENVKRRLSKVDSPMLLHKQSEDVSLFEDSSIREHFEKKEESLKANQKMSQVQYLCQEFG